MQPLQKAFAEAPRVTAEALLENRKKNLLRESSRKLLFWTCSRESKNAGRGSFAEGPAEGSPYVHLKYEGIKNKTQLLVISLFSFRGVYSKASEICDSVDGQNPPPVGNLLYISWDSFDRNG